MKVKGTKDQAAPKRRTGTIATDKRGRIKPFEPTPEQHQLVSNLAGIGCTQDEIVECVPWNRPDGEPIDLKTLRKHFAKELKRGLALRHMKVRKRIMDHIDEGNVTMAIFYAKTQLGWKEAQAIEHTGKDGAPLPAAAAGPILYLPAKDPDPHLPPAPAGAPTEEAP